jgi:hypothetical protein
MEVTAFDVIQASYRAMRIDPAFSGFRHTVINLRPERRMAIARYESKGDETPERPHRMARVISYPDEYQAVRRRFIGVALSIAPKIAVTARLYNVLAHVRFSPWLA